MLVFDLRFCCYLFLVWTVRLGFVDAALGDLFCLPFLIVCWIACVLILFVLYCFVLFFLFCLFAWDIVGLILYGYARW